MKRITIILLAIIFAFGSLNAQFQSVRDGNWDDPLTWSNDPDATAIPDSNYSVTISHHVVIEKYCDGWNPGPRCFDLVIDSTGYVTNYSSGYTCGNLEVFNNFINYGTFIPGAEIRLTIRGNLYNYGKFTKPENSTGNHTITLFGDLINYGSFRAHGWSDASFLQGIAFDGGGAHKIRTFNDSTIFISRIDFRDSSDYIIIDSVASISARIDLHNSKIILPSDNGYDNILYLENTDIYKGIIEGNHQTIIGKEGTNNHLGNPNENAWSSDSLIIKNINLFGDFQIAGGNNAYYGDVDNITFEGETNFYGTMSEYWGFTGWKKRGIVVKGEYTNYGKIYSRSTTNDDGLSVNFSDAVFINSGELGSARLNFKGNCQFETADSIGVRNFNAVDSNTVVTITSGDIFFKNTVYADFHGGTLNLPPNSKFYATYMWYNILENITLNANNSEFYFPHTEENVIITNPKIKYLAGESNCLLTGNVEIIPGGTLIAYADCSPTVTIEGDLKNYGSVRNHYTYGNLRLEVTGNILHDGNRWDNYETKLIGTEDQAILIPNDSAWAGKIVLEAMLTGANYQWQKDGVDIAGANSAQLTFASGLNSSDYGNYQCIVDGTPSRNIFIGNALPDAFEIYDVTMKTVDSTSTMIFWKTSVPAKGFIFYAENDASNGYPLEADEPGDFTTEHCMTLSDLNFGSVYYFIIDQNDADYAHNVRSEEFNFTAGDFTLGALEINTVVDVPEDQGGWVYLNFNADILDATGSIKFYGVYEYMNEEWVSLGSVPATQESAYTFLAHTYKDSSDEGNYWSKFYITAHTDDPYVYFVSAVDSGYSVDNLAPQAPEGLIPFVPESGEFVQLVWNRNSEEDVDYYCVYKNNEKIATLIDTTFVDSSITDGQYEYKITAVDFHGNESDFSVSVSVLVGVDEEDELPTKFELMQNYPNPFNPSTTIKYSITKTVRVTLKVYDTLGKEITTLVNEIHPAGNYKITFDATNLPAGIYFYRIRSGDFISTKKMVLLK